MEEQKQTSKISLILSSLLAKRFALYTVTLSVVIAAVIFTTFIFYYYHHSINSLKKELAQIESSLKNSLALNLWQLNTEALNTIANDLLVDKDIVYVKILDDEGNIIVTKGRKPKLHFIKRSIPIYYYPRGSRNGIYVGRLEYIATTENVLQRVKQIATLASLAIFIFFFILSLLILYLYWNSTVKHLLVIKEYTNKIRLGGYKREIGDLVLNRTIGKNGKKDALDELVSTINEMHREIIEKYKALEHQSLHDSLTGLPNRRFINKLIQEKIEQCKVLGGYCALLDMDLDHFKLLNESIGHTTGDLILREVATRLVSVCKNECQPARISGDEFVVLYGKVYSSREKTIENVRTLSNKLLSSISQPIKIDGNSFKITCCIGICVFGSEATLDVVMKQADNALYHAKSRGPGNVSIFQQSMQKKIDRRLQLEQLLDCVIEKDLLSIYFQPKYDIHKNVCSAESLVRMFDEKGNIISPGEFIPILEETGAIVEIGDYIIEKVFKFIQGNRSIFERSKLKNIAINVSPTQYNSKGFADRVINLAQKLDINPELIIFEITEEVVAGNISSVVDVMNQLTQLGFKFSIDDFGSGYSSLRYLKNLPLSELKIDKSFIDDITVDDKAKAIVKTIIDIAHNLGLEVVAEGVETEEQFNILLKYGCDQYQGFLFSKPLPDSKFLDILKSNIS